jgi:membrane protease YdiL (CAAX protease family)
LLFSLEVRAIGLLAFSALIAIVAVIAWRAERLSWSQVGFGQMSWATPLRAAVLTLFCVAVLGPVVIWILNELGLQPFDVARLQFVGLPTWYLVTAIVIVAAEEEWLYRGYAIERLEAVTGNAWTAGGISLLNGWALQSMNLGTTPSAAMIVLAPMLPALTGADREFSGCFQRRRTSYAVRWRLLPDSNTDGSLRNESCKAPAPASPASRPLCMMLFQLLRSAEVEGSLLPI